MTTQHWIMDASAFFSNLELTYLEKIEFYTTSAIYEEIKINPQVSRQLQILKIRQVFHIEDPVKSVTKQIEKKAKRTGDFGVLSSADISILALAHEKNQYLEKTTIFLVSDDYAVQNVGEQLGIQTKALKRKKIEETVQWQVYCSDCAKIFSKGSVGDECIDCGGHLKRRKKYRRLR